MWRKMIALLVAGIVLAQCASKTVSDNRTHDEQMKTKESGMQDREELEEDSKYKD